MTQIAVGDQVTDTRVNHPKSNKFPLSTFDFKLRSHTLAVGWSGGCEWRGCMACCAPVGVTWVLNPPTILDKVFP